MCVQETRKEFNWQQMFCGKYSSFETPSIENMLRRCPAGKLKI